MSFVLLWAAGCRSPGSTECPSWLAWLAFYLMGKRRKIVFDNLQLAFGSTESRDGYRAIVKRAFCDSLKNAVEVAKLIFSGPPFIKGIMSIDGIEHLERALGLGRGVVAVSAHMGNFPLSLPRRLLLTIPATGSRTF